MGDGLNKTKNAAFSTLTVRHISTDVDVAITAQAKSAGKSKSDYIQEFLSASFGDLIGNFSRTSELVALMDRELSTVTGLPLTPNWYDAGRTLAENREYCRLLDIRSEGDLQRIMMSAVPWLCLGCALAVTADTPDRYRHSVTAAGDLPDLCSIH